MLTKSWVHAGALLALVLSIILFSLVSFGCGGGSGPVNIPVDQNHADPQAQVEYRLYVLDLPDGGQKITELYARQGVNTPWEIRYDFRTVSMGGNWSPVAQDSTLDITIEGAPSGHKMPDIGLTGGQYRIRGGTYRLEASPIIGGQLGSTYLVLKVRESGASVRISVTILPPSGGGNSSQSCEELHPNAPEIVGGDKWDCVNGIWTNLGPVNPPPDCRDEHPVKEAIGGFWWDCVNGGWQNTGVPVNPPPQDKDLFPLDANPTAYYCPETSGQNYTVLTLQSLPDGVGWVYWNIDSGPSGAELIPLGNPPSQGQLWYYSPGQYQISATPFATQASYELGGVPVGNPAVFTVNVILAPE